MLAQHFSQLLTNPRTSLEAAEKQPAGLFDIVLHIVILALIPTVCGYVATVYIGWDLGAGERFFIPAATALPIAIVAFITFSVGVFALGYAIQWVAAGSFELKPAYLQCVKLALFTSVPIFLTGFSALLPVLIFDFSIGLLAVAAALFLLYTGAPIFLHIPKEKGFVFSTWVVVIALVMLVMILGLSVFFFSHIR